eukprot:347659_1
MASLSNANPRTSSSHYSGYDATQIRLYDAMIEAENSCLRIHIFAEARHHSVLSVQMIMCFTIQQIIHQSVELVCINPLQNLSHCTIHNLNNARIMHPHRITLRN